MALQMAPSPVIKFEVIDPVGPYVSTPGETTFSSYFAPTTPASHSEMTPPPSVDPEDDNDGEASPGPPDKKPAKKRKSWGQVLPEPKTNLPPRKRAKTEDEKEQRRVERVLRNRRAAQSSRERKRLEVEALEKRNKELESLLINVQKANLMLVNELNRFRRDSGVVTRSPTSLDSLRDNQITLSQQLFGSQADSASTSDPSATNLVDELMMSATNPTVNPASLSPELTPIPDNAATASAPKVRSSEQTAATSPDLTQRPAVSHVDGGAPVAPGLAVSGLAPLGLDPAPQDDSAFSLGDSLGLSAAIDADRYVLESGLLSSPDSSTLGDDYLACDSTASLPSQSAFDFFNIDDFLSDEAGHATSDTVAAGDDATNHGLEPQVYDSEIQVP